MNSNKEKSLNEAQNKLLQEWKLKNEELQRLLDEKTSDLNQKNRELEIEASLEKIRTRSLAMHSSDELVEASDVFFRQLKILGIETIRTGIALFDEKNETIEIWSRTYTGEHSKNKILGLVPKNSHIFFEKCFEAWRRKELYFTYEIEGKEVKQYYKSMSSILSYPEEKVFNPREYFNIFYFHEGSFNVVSHNKLTEEEINIMLRFARVFGLIYRRFLDLQKAEAQAREAQIEAALEKVRGRAMAMHNSSDLSEAAGTVFTELNKLEINPIRSGFVLLTKESRKAKLYPATSFDNKIPISFTGEFEFTGHPVFEKQYESWQKKEYYFPELEGEVLKSYYKILAKGLSVPYKNFPTKKKQYGSFLPFAEGFLFAWSEEPYSENEISILDRFKTILDLTIRRYIDLQKAEAQTREAKIEAALERVRSRAMAMHKTDELLGAAELISKELSSLGITIMNTSYAFVDDEEKYGYYYSLNPVDGKIPPFPFVFPHTETEVMRSLLSSWKKQEAFNVIELDEEATVKHQTYIGEHINNLIIKNKINIPFSVGAFLAVSPKTAVIYSFNFSKGYLFIIGEERLSPMQEEMVLRFTKVFELAYRRFLDLKQAEEQARKAQIELALERVRARTMAMQSSTELSETSFVLFQQFKELGVKAEQLSIGIVDEKSGQIELSATVYGSQLPQTYIVNLDESYFMKSIYDAWKSKQKNFKIEIKGNQLNEYNVWRNKYLGKEIYSTDNDESCRWIAHASFFSQGMLSISTSEDPSPKTLQLLDRFAGVFDLTYTRFLDLKRAEEQARESQIEAALERVRSKAMAMHKSDDLNTAVATVFEEMDKLNLGILRCGIGILDKENRSADVYTTTISEGGRVVQASGDESMDIHPLLQEAFDAWLRQGDSSYILEGEDLINYYKALGQTNFKLPDSQIILSNPESHRQFYYVTSFKSGGLFAFSEIEISDEAKSVMKRFADVFNLTYTRFLDLQRAEAQTHKAQIEAAMEKVRARALAMQEPEELVEVIKVLRHEMGLLGVEELETGTVFIYDETSEMAECWFAVRDEKRKEMGLIADHVIIDPSLTKFGREMLAFFNSKKDDETISIPVKGQDRREWIEYVYKLSPAFDGFFGNEIPDRIFHLYKHSNGAVGVTTTGEISSESWELLQRVASVFSLAYSRYKDLTQARNDLMLLKEEKKRSDSLLLNILPEEIAAELKQFGKSYARKHDEVSILFADIRGFSTIAEKLSAQELVTQLDECFRAFDYIVEKHGLEKIKTVGDAYVCAGGLPKPVHDNAVRTVRAAIDMMNFINGFGLTKKIQDLPVFEFRIGIHTGPVITGVVGLKKFTYDIWGDAVNMAARMEQHGEAGKINISENTHKLVKDKFKCISRGSIEAKNKGKVEMYFVVGTV